MSGLQKPRDPYRGAVESDKLRGVRPDIVHETELRRVRQQIESNMPAGGGGGAPTTAAYLVGAADATLSAERVVTDTGTVTWDLGTPGEAKANVPDATTAAKGAVELATSGENAAGVVVQGNDARLSDARAPTGSASGDLGGTYPSPTVTQARGLRETAGPTTLTIGAIVDGEFLKRDGATIVSQAGGGGGAPTTAEYLVGAADGGLSAERVVTDTATIEWDLGVAGQAKANVASVPAHEHDAGDIISGTLAVARVGTGSGDATTFLNGSGAFAAVTGLPTTKRLNTQHDIASATGTEVTDLSVTLVAGTYTFTYYLITQAANTTVGLSLGVNYTGTVTRMGAFMRYVDTGTTATTGVADDVSAAGVESIHGSFAANSKSSTTPNLGPLTNHVAATADTLVIVEGIMVVSDGGDIELWHASDAANNTSLMVGSSLVLLRTA